MLKKIFFLLLISIPLSTYAQENTVKTAIFECDKKEVNIGEDVTCRISLSSEMDYSKIEFDLDYTNNIKLIDVRSNYSKIWKIDNQNNHITSSLLIDETKTGLQEFGIILIRPQSSGIYELKLKNIKTNNEEFKDISTSLKVISTNNNVKKIKINDNELINFSNSEKIYNIETKEEKIKIEVNTENEFAKVSGDGEYEFNKESSELIVPIEVKSENGNINSFVLRFSHKNINEELKQLSGIIIKDNKGNNLLINFSKDIYDYYLDLSSNIEYIEVKPTLDNNNLSFAKGYGEQKVKLNYGENIIQIKVQDSLKNEKTYVLFATKTLLNADSNNYLKDLKIDNYNLEFNKKIRKYSLNIKKNTDKLNIIPILESDKSSYLIKGNENLKDGSIIKIIVTAENESKNIYQIIIKTKKFDYLKLSIIILIGIISCLTVKCVKENKQLFLNRKKSKNKKLINKSTQKRNTKTTRNKRTNKSNGKSVSRSNNKHSQNKKVLPKSKKKTTKRKMTTKKNPTKK